MSKNEAATAMDRACKAAFLTLWLYLAAAWTIILGLFISREPYAFIPASLGQWCLILWIFLRIYKFSTPPMTPQEKAEAQTFFDIDTEVRDALGWAFKTHGCKGCTSKTPEEHDPICRLSHLITISSGKNGKVVIANPHPSVTPAIEAGAVQRLTDECQGIFDDAKKYTDFEIPTWLAMRLMGIKEALTPFQQKR